jgi:hypothetical protein
MPGRIVIGRRYFAAGGFLREAAQLDYERLNPDVPSMREHSATQCIPVGL